MIVAGPILPLAALVWPLLMGLLAALPSMRARALWLLPLAPLPALWVALAGAQGLTEAPDLLLGVTLRLTEIGALLLGMTAALWLAAGIYALGYMPRTHDPAILTGFWCLTLSGNLGVFLAADGVTFYVAFAAVSLAAYFLVVHERTERALRAGRLYIVLAVLGEACLLLAITIAAAAADSLMIDDLRAALGEAPLGALAAGLYVAGFGLKAGLMPLHVWLPLAHPAAPTPGSAVLSGAIVKAGIMGLILFLPDGAVGWAPVMLGLGIGGAFVAALIGLTQANAKAVLAYSTVSQMGLVIAITAAGASTQAAFYALHHGLAKGALFLSVGLIAAAGAWRVLALGLAAVAALSVAGLPLTGGALVKAAAKPALGGWAETALTVSAVTTTLLLGWFLHVAARQEAKAGHRRAAMWAPVALLVLAALVLPWVLWAGWSGLPADYPLRAGTLRDAGWPLGLGAAVAGLALWRGWRAPVLPEGDIAPLLERMAAALARWLRALNLRLDRSDRGGARPVAALAHAVERLAHAAARGEAVMTQWRWTGPAVLVLAGLVWLAL